MNKYTPKQIDKLCQIMHDAYEQAAVEAGWETQSRSRKPWSGVFEATKATMRVAVMAMVESIAFGENLAKRDRDIAARAWDEGATTVYQDNDLVGGILSPNPYREERE